MGFIRRVVLAIGLATLLTLWFGPRLITVAPSLAIRPSVNRVATGTHTEKLTVHRPSRRPETMRVRLTAANTVLGFAPPPIMARAAFLMDMQSGKVLFQKNPDERLPMASTTKITTAVVALQHTHVSDLAWVSKRAATIGESTMVLQRGERLTVKQLLYGLLLNSANDAAITLAEHVSGSEERFVVLMNDLASWLHMWNTHYVTAHGLDAPGHFTSARDLATIATYAMRNPVFRKVVATTSYYIPKTRHNHVHWLASVNRVIYWYPGVDGVKPGDTDDAGLCQVVTAWRNGRHVLAVLLNTPNLVTDIRNLLDFGGSDFRWVQADAYWDAPFNSESGVGTHHWLYFPGAGHFVRDLFLAYFNTHGGLRTLGYPRTEAISENGQTVQYFQGGKLVYDPSHVSVYPEPLGVELAVKLTPAAITVMRTPSKTFRASYKQLGGAGVLGRPVTNAMWVHGERVEFFEYGELLHAGANYVVPVGDAQLRLRGWLPATGAGDAYPSTMSRDSIAFLSPPRPPKHPAASRMTALRRHVLVERFASFLRARASRPKAARTSKTSSS